MINIKKNKRGTSEKELKEIEDSLGIDLPKSYFDFLLEYNGGTPESNIAKSKIGKSIEFMVQEFYGLSGREDLQTNINAYYNRLPNDIIPIASVEGGNLLCISLRVDTFGFVYFWNHEVVDDENPSIDMLDFVSKNFNEFLNRGLLTYEYTDNQLKGYEVIKVRTRVSPEFLKKISEDE